MKYKITEIYNKENGHLEGELMKAKPYTKHKKNTKKQDITGAEWKTLEEIGQYKKETQLDRIEHKLDKLLTRPNIVINPSPPGPWMGPAPCNPDKSNPNYEKAPWWMNPEVGPHDY